MSLVIGMSTSGPVLGVNLSKKSITCLADCSMPPAFSRWSIAISTGPCYVDFSIAFISGYGRVVLSSLRSCILPAGQMTGKAVIKFLVAHGTGGAGCRTAAGWFLSTPSCTAILLYSLSVQLPAVGHDH